MRKIIIFLVLVISATIRTYAQAPVSDPHGSWTLRKDYSDEFNEKTLNDNMWDNDINNWGSWTWDAKNVYLSKGAMHIRMVNEQHIRGKKTLYFKSGAARQKKNITYGYFEAKVKGCQKWPGVCPAFWMYSYKQPVANGVKYNEIDFMEIQQRQFNLRKIDCNLHLERIVDGKKVRTNPPTEYDAPFEPNDGFHIYGCNVTPVKITFYIDGVEVGSKVNDYFNLPMRIMLSMAIRPPLLKYENKKKLGVEITNDPTFPTEMEVDYVRVWQKPGINILAPVL